MDRTYKAKELTHTHTHTQCSVLRQSKSKYILFTDIIIIGSVAGINYKKE